MSGPDEIKIWGIHPVLELLRNDPKQLRKIAVQNSSRNKMREIIDLAGRAGIQLTTVDQIKLRGETGINHQGVIAWIKEIPLVNLESLLAEQPTLLVALDSISDPHNLGAIIRSAAAAGAEGVLIPRDRAAQITGTVVKTAAGAISHLKVCQVTNLADSLKTLKKAGFWIFGAAGEGSQTIYEADFSGQTCLVIGSEGKGIRPLVRKQCDFLIKIPMKNAINSLNASVAAGIMLFEIARQKKRS